MLTLLELKSSPATMSISETQGGRGGLFKTRIGRGQHRRAVGGGEAESLFLNEGEDVRAKETGRGNFRTS